MIDDLNEPFSDIILAIDYIILALRMICGPNELDFDMPETCQKYLCFHLEYSSRCR